MTDQALTTAARRRCLGAVILSMFAIGVHFGIMVPLVALILEREGVGAGVIGLNAAMQPLAILLLGPFLAGIVGRLGAVRSLYGGFLLATLALLAMPLWPSVTAWFLLRFLIGAGLALPWLIAETWVNLMAAEQSRGRVIAFYTTAFYSGLGLGPLALEFLGTAGWTPFLAGAGSLLLCALPIVLVQDMAPALPRRPRLRLFQVVLAAPLVTACALVAGFTEAASYTLLPVYGLRSALDQGQAVFMLTVFMAGAIVLQAPLGLIADRVDRRALVVVCALGSLLCCVLLPSAVQALPWLWPLLVIWGGLVLGFYTLGLTLLGQRFGPLDLPVANALFILCYELGSVVGPAVAGAAMDLWDPHGLLLAMALALVPFMVLAARRPPR